MKSIRVQLADGAAHTVQLDARDARWLGSTVIEIDGVPYELDIQLRPHATGTRDPVGSFFGIGDEAWAARARTTPLHAATLLKGGTSLVMRLDLEDGLRVAYKPAQINAQTVPRYEVATYRVNGLLGLALVPPALLRDVSTAEILAVLPKTLAFQRPRIEAEVVEGAPGVVSSWIPAFADPELDTLFGQQLADSALRVDGDIAVRIESLVRDLSDLAVLDFVTANEDRFSGGNLLADATHTRLYALDNSLGYSLEHDGAPRSRRRLMRTQRFASTTVASLRALDLGRLAEVLGPLLEPDEIAAVHGRAARVVARVESLVSRFGEDKVLCL